MSAVEFAAQRGFSATRISCGEERFKQKPAGTVSFVAVPLLSQHVVELEHREVTVGLGALGVDELARLVVLKIARASGC